MKEQGFPPPNPSPRDLELERRTQEEYYRLQDAESLPRGGDGEPISFPEFMERTYTEAIGSGAMERTEFEDGSSVRISSALAGKKSRDANRRRRGGGSKKAKAASRKEEQEPVSESADEALAPEAAEIAKIEAKLNEFRGAFDTAYSAALKVFRENQTPSPELNAAWERYVSASQELDAHEEAYESYTLDASGIAAANTELELLKKALITAEAYLTRATSEGIEAPVESRQAGDSDETPAEKRRRLRSSLQEVQNLKVAQETLGGKEDAEGIQDKYFAALEAHNKKRNLLSVAGADLVGDDLLTPEKLKKMRKEWIASRAGLARAMHESVDARIAANPSAARDALLERMKGKYGENAERGSLHARYERRFGRAAIILDAEREELAAKERGLSDREKGILDKAYDRYKQLPSGVRILSTTALMFGAGAVMAGTPAGWAALGMAGGGALLRWAAEAKKSKLLGAAATGLSVAGLVGLGFDKLAGATHQVLGTKKHAKQTLTKKEGFGDLSDLKQLEKLANERKSALVVEKNIARHRRWARVLGSIGAGWLFGQMGRNDGAEQDANGNESTDARSETAERSAAPQARSGAETDGASATEQSASAAGAGARAQEGVAGSATEQPTVQHASVIERGEGFNTLFAEVQFSVREAGDTSPLAQRLMGMSPTELSDLVNAYDPETGGSMVMQPGDKLYIEGDTLVFERGGQTQVLMEVENGQVQTHAFEDPQMMGVRVAPASEVAAPAAETPGPSEELPGTTATADPAEGAQPEVQEQAAPVFAAGYANPGEGQGAEAQPSGTPQSGSEGAAQPQFARDYISGEDTAEVLTNARGVEITPDTAAVYELRMEGIDRPYVVVSGGTPEQASLLAQQYANEHPGSTVYFENPVRDPLTGQVQNRLDAWDTVASSSAERIDDVRPDPEAPGARVPSMNTEDFTRRLSNAS